MNELIAAMSSLPNLHPALVHFPIALLPTALLFDLAAFVLRDHRGWLDRAASALHMLAATAAGAAYWAGRHAADSLVGLSPRTQVLIGDHRDAALLTLWCVGLLAVVRVGLGLRPKFAQCAWLRVVCLLWALLSVWLVTVAADRGGALVFRHGVAVAVSGGEAEGASEVESGDTASQVNGTAGTPESRLRRFEDGTTIWQPWSGDGEAIGTILQPAAGSSTVAVQWEESVEASSAGLSLRVDGSTILVLPGDYGGVQVEAELESVGFDGVVGVAHHVRGVGDTGLFTISIPSGDVALITREAGREDVMARGSVSGDMSTLRLAVFAAGRHFRGMQSGEVVVHGHRSALTEGAAGLYLAGRGVVRILSLKAVPLVE